MKLEIICLKDFLLVAAEQFKNVVKCLTVKHAFKLKPDKMGSVTGVMASALLVIIIIPGVTLIL